MFKYFNKTISTPIALLVIMLAAIVLAGFVWWQNINLKLTNQNLVLQQQEQPKTEEPPTGEVDTSNWKTYKNSAYGFRFEYPPDFTISEDRVIGFTVALESPGPDGRTLIVQPNIGFDFFDEYLPLDWEQALERAKALLEETKTNISATEQEAYKKMLEERASRIQTITFCGRRTAALTIVEPDVFENTVYHTLKVLDLQGLQWSENNRIQYEVAESDVQLKAKFDRVLVTFEFIAPTGKIFSNEEMANIRAANARAIAGMSGLRTALELFYSEKESYAGFTCDYSKESKNFCSDIKNALGSQPVTRLSPQAYCAYIKLIPEDDISQFYCISSDGSALETTIDPSLSLCRGNSFRCPWRNNKI